MPLKAALDRGTGRSPVPTAQLSPAEASLGSAVEQGSGSLRSSPPRPPPGAAALLLWNMGNRRNRPFLHASEGWGCPQLA